MNPRWVATSALALGALTGLTGCGSGSSPDPNQNGGGGSSRKLVYTATVAGSTDIYAMNPDGSGQTRITTDGAAKWHPALSPDGSRVAYLIPQNGGTSPTRLMVTSVAGGSPQEVPVALDIPGAPRWTPSGNTLVISSYQIDGSSRRSTILRVGLDGTSQTIQPTLPTGEKLPGFNPDVSPSDGKIVFSGVSGGAFKIWTMDSDGGNLQRIEADNWQSEPRFSPDGKQLVFHQHRGSGTSRDLYVSSTDGSNARLLVADSPVSNDPVSASWSPDGKRIVYAASGGFFSIKTDGTDNTPLIPNLGGPATLGQVSWK